MYCPVYKIHDVPAHSYSGSTALSVDIEPNALRTLSFQRDGADLFPCGEQKLHRRENLSRSDGEPKSLNALLKNQLVLFGYLNDPFFPFHGKFDVALKVLEKLLRAPTGWVHIQTRSPLIILALPILSTFRSKISVNIPIEIEDDAQSKQLFPTHPFPSERREAAALLNKKGILTDNVVSAT